VYTQSGRSPAPPVEVRLDRLAVVAGTYPGADRLEHAEAEAKDLQSAYGATVLPARARPILDCLRGEPVDGSDPLRPFDALHLAAHGNLDDSGYSDGIRLEDGRYLDPLAVRGVVRSPVRLVFLNACLLGRGQSMLGDAAGMAPALVAIGACAVVAPLWRVDDAVARDVALRFFAALRSGSPSPAEFFAAERSAGASSGAGTPDGTRLAYLFFGHPRMRVVWTER
jgi:CHAT domain-containing protein